MLCFFMDKILFFLFLFLRVTKARLDPLVLLVLQVPQVPEAPLGTQARTGHVGLLASR